MTDSQLYSSTFLITSLNHQKYDRVARLTATSTDPDPSLSTSLTLDINTELYPCTPGETIQLVLASTLSLSGAGSDESGGEASKSWSQLQRSGEATLADAYDYVCRGKVYRFEEVEGGDGMEGGGRVRVFVSFGGLLMSLEGGWKGLAGVRMEYVYLLIKK